MSRAIINGSPNGHSLVNGEGQVSALRHSPGSGPSFNGGTSFEVISPSSSGSRTPADLSFVNPMGMGQLSMTDISLEQAVDKVQELMKENKELREYMKENNEMMRQQYQVLAEYKEKVQESNLQTKEKFEQTRKVIVELRKENDQLKESLQSSLEAVENHTLTERISELEKTQARLTEENSAKEQLIGGLKGQLKELSLNSKSNQATVPSSDVVYVAKSKDEEIVKQITSERECLADEVKTLQQQLQAGREEISKMDAILKKTEKMHSDSSNENLELSNKLQTVLIENKTLKTENKTIKADVEDLTLNLEKLSKENEEKDGILKSMGYTVVEGMAKPGELPSMPTMSSKEEDQLQKQGIQMATPSEVMLQVQDTSQIDHLQRQLSHKERQMDELVMELHQKDQELQHLRDDRNKQVQSPTHTGDIQSLRSQNLTLMSEVKETHSKLESSKQAVDKKNSRIAELEERMKKMQEDFMKTKDEDAAVMQSLRMSLKGYEDALNAERREHQNTKKQLMEMKQTFNSLMSDYKSVLNNFESYKENSIKQQKASMDSAERQKLVEKISQLTAEMMAGEEAGKYREAQIRSLKEEIAGLKAANETIPVLRAQADVWKADFDAERNSRERQHTENQQLKQELRNLQLQNQQLLEEMETMSKGQFAEMQRKHGGGAGPHHQQLHNYLQVTGPSTPQVYRPPIQYPDQDVVPPPAPHGQLTHAYVNYPYPPRQYPGGAEAGSGQPMSRGGGHQEEEYQPLCCPKCGVQCPDVDTLQIHVLDCIDH